MKLIYSKPYTEEILKHGFHTYLRRVYYKGRKIQWILAYGGIVKIHLAKALEELYQNLIKNDKKISI